MRAAIKDSPNDYSEHNEVNAFYSGVLSASGIAKISHSNKDPLYDVLPPPSEELVNGWLQLPNIASYQLKDESSYSRLPKVFVAEVSNMPPDRLAERFHRGGWPYVVVRRGLPEGVKLSVLEHEAREFVIERDLLRKDHSGRQYGDLTWDEKIDLQRKVHRIAEAQEILSGGYRAGMPLHARHEYILKNSGYTMSAWLKLAREDRSEHKAFWRENFSPEQAEILLAYEQAYALMAARLFEQAARNAGASQERIDAVLLGEDVATSGLAQDKAAHGAPVNRQPGSSFGAVSRAAKSPVAPQGPENVGGVGLTTKSLDMQTTGAMKFDLSNTTPENIIGEGLVFNITLMKQGVDVARFIGN